MKTSLLSLALGLMAILAISACKKDPITPPNNTPTPLEIYYTVDADTVVHFSSNAVGGGTYKWYFTDNRGSYDATPSYRYEIGGDHIVDLEVTYTNANNTTTTKSASRIITVPHPSAYPYVKFKILNATITQCSILGNWDHTNSVDSLPDVRYFVTFLDGRAIAISYSASNADDNISSADLPKTLHSAFYPKVSSIDSTCSFKLLDVDSTTSSEIMTEFYFHPSDYRPAPSADPNLENTTVITLSNSTTTIMVPLIWSKY